MKELLEIIKSIDFPIPNINPTEIFNEGWMTRLLVSQSIKHEIVFRGINFGKIKNWTSEALISSPFVGAKKNREGYTHADIALGDFNVNYEERGEIQIDSDASIFGIIEAKMGSNLSQGTKNASNYNQGSRNLACIASQTHHIDCSTFFIVVAPKLTIEKHCINKQVELDNMLGQIQNRFIDYSDDFKREHNMNSIIKKAKKTKVDIWDYQDWINAFDGNPIWYTLDKFYVKSLKWNRI